MVFVEFLFSDGRLVHHQAKETVGRRPQRLGDDKTFIRYTILIYNKIIIIMKTNIIPIYYYYYYRSNYIFMSKLSVTCFIAVN